jgi:hypothetical protein
LWWGMGDFDVRLLLIADANAGGSKGPAAPSRRGPGPCWGYLE